MGLVEDLLGGIFKCLCGSNSGGEGGNQGEPQRPPSQPADIYVPPTVSHQPQAHQPAPIYPPAPPPKPQPHAQQPAHAGQPHKPAQEHKKHKKHGHGHQNGSTPGGGQTQPQPAPNGSGDGAYTAHTPGHTSPPSSPPSRPWSPGRPDPNQVNQHNEYYVGLRARANAAGDEMGRSFDEAHKAYEDGDGARAKELSNAGKAAQKEMERLNDEAAAWIFRENNTDSQPGEIDLHGLYVKEAIRYTDQSIQEARSRGDRQIRLIVGKGLHSSNHVAKIKPAIEELMQKHGLVAELDEKNAGVLIVNLDGQTSGNGPVMGPDELTRGLERKDECIVM